MAILFKLEVETVFLFASTLIKLSTFLLSRIYRVLVAAQFRVVQNSCKQEKKNFICM